MPWIKLLIKISLSRCMFPTFVAFIFKRSNQTISNTIYFHFMNSKVGWKYFDSICDIVKEKVMHCITSRC